MKLREFVDLGGVYVPKSAHFIPCLWTWSVCKSTIVRILPRVCGLDCTVSARGSLVACFDKTRIYYYAIYNINRGLGNCLM